MFLFGGGQVVGQGDGVVFVDLGGHLVEPGDEGVLDPVDEELDEQNEEAVGRERPEALWNGIKGD